MGYVPHQQSPYWDTFCRTKNRTMLHHDLKVKVLYITLSRKKTFTWSNCRWLTSFLITWNNTQVIFAKQSRVTLPQYFLNRPFPQLPQYTISRVAQENRPEN